MLHVSQLVPELGVVSLEMPQPVTFDFERVQLDRSLVVLFLRSIDVFKLVPKTSKICLAGPAPLLESVSAVLCLLFFSFGHLYDFLIVVALLGRLLLKPCPLVSLLSPEPCPLIFLLCLEPLLILLHPPLVLLHSISLGPEVSL